MRALLFLCLLGLVSVSAAGESATWQLPVVMPAAMAASKQHVVNLPVVRAQPIVNPPEFLNLPTETRPQLGVESQPIQMPVQVKPIIVQEAIYSQNEPIVQTSQAVLQQGAPEVDTTVAPAQYVAALVNKQHFTQPILQPKIITQPITHQTLLEQPIFRQHIVQQPLIRPIITQPVITPNLLEKVTVQNQVTEQQIITPKITEQTVVQPVLQEKQFQNEAITQAPVLGTKQHAGALMGASSGFALGQQALGQPMSLGQPQQFQAPLSAGYGGRSYTGMNLAQPLMASSAMRPAYPYQAPRF